MSAISDQLAAEALKAATVSNDGVTVSRRSLSELIEYQKHLAGQAAAADMARTTKAIFSKFVANGGH